jgi:hypothetical protein
LAVAEGLKMHAPIFFPDGGFHAGKGGPFCQRGRALILDIWLIALAKNLWSF